MSILEHEVRSANKSSLTASQRHLFSVEDYYRMGEAGVFGDAQVELIEGEIIEMRPIGTVHATINDPLYSLLKEAFGVGHTVRSQAPISIIDDDKVSEPQPDLAVAIGSWRNYLTQHPSPSEIKLVVEIADSTLAYDRTIKTALYATADIPEYWIVNLVDNQLEVYRNPISAAYSERTIYRIDETVEPLLAPEKALPSPILCRNALQRLILFSQ